MTIDPTTEMRTAVAAGDWPNALRLWEEYTARMLQEIEQHTCTQARLLEARDFLEWARRMAVCSRAQAQLQLDSIHAARKYEPQDESPPSSLQARL